MKTYRPAIMIITAVFVCGIAAPVTAQLPAECVDIADSAGPPPVDLMNYCRQFVEPRENQQIRLPTDMADGPEGVFGQCASMTLNAPETVSLVGSITHHAACDYANNDFTKYYCYDFLIPATLVEVDPLTCNQTVIGTATNQVEMGGMAWDGTTGTMYAVDGGNMLYTVNLGNGASNPIGVVTNVSLLVAIGVDNSGDLYGHDIGTDAIYYIDKTTAAGTLRGPTGFDANYSQGMDFDHSDNTCYLFAFDNGGFEAVLMSCNTNTGAATYLGSIGSTTPTGVQDWAAGAIRADDVPVELESFSIE
jgi:hypothetical protein